MMKSVSAFPASYIPNRATANANPPHNCITSEYMFYAAKKGVDSQTTVSLEEDAKLVNVSPFM
jgi:hypothetical protein